LDQSVDQKEVKVHTEREREGERERRGFVERQATQQAHPPLSLSLSLSHSLSLSASLSLSTYPCTTWDQSTYQRWENSHTLTQSFFLLSRREEVERERGEERDRPWEYLFPLSLSLSHSLSQTSPYVRPYTTWDQ
jgi:hypothetical protein